MAECCSSNPAMHIEAADLDAVQCLIMIHNRPLRSLRRGAHFAKLLLVCLAQLLLELCFQGAAKPSPAAYIRGSGKQGCVDCQISKRPEVAAEAHLAELLLELCLQVAPLLSLLLLPSLLRLGL